MAEVKYQYAYDENGQLVSINDYTKGSSKLHSFKCISCGDILLPRAIGSEHRKAHFYHKSNDKCSGETYLHKLGKLLIKKKFDNSNEFIISYLATKKCNKKTCRLRNIECSFREHVKIDLKEYYDTCSVEVNYKGFIADLLLTSSKDSDIQPVFIEIFVSHACEEDKLKSGLRIIEIPISSEQELRELEEYEVLEEPWFLEKRKKGIKFISFKRELEYQMESDIYRYILYSEKDEENYFTKIKCKDAGHKLLRNSQIELNLVNVSNCMEVNEYHALIWLSKNKFLRRCNLCKFFYATQYEHNAYCRLSKKHGTPKYPNMNHAERCRSYNISKIDDFIGNNDGTYIEEVSSTKGARSCFRVIIAGSSSFSDYDLFKKKCDYYLSSKMKEYAVIIICGTSTNTTSLINRYAEENSLLIEYNGANWDRDGRNAGYISNEKMLENANALIAFSHINDSPITITNSLIGLARSKGIRVAVINYQ